MQTGNVRTAYVTKSMKWAQTCFQTNMVGKITRVPTLSLFTVHSRVKYLLSYYSSNPSLQNFNGMETNYQSYNKREPAAVSRVNLCYYKDSM